MEKKEINEAGVVVKQHFDQSLREISDCWKTKIRTEMKIHPAGDVMTQYLDDSVKKTLAFKKNNIREQSEYIQQTM